MTIKFYDWRHDDGYLYLTKVGFNASGLFAELASVPSELKTRNENQIRSYICENVNTLCIKGGGRFTNEAARSLLVEYTTV